MGFNPFGMFGGGESNFDWRNQTPNMTDEQWAESLKQRDEIGIKVDYQERAALDNRRKAAAAAQQRLNEIRAAREEYVKRAVENPGRNATILTDPVDAAAPKPPTTDTVIS